MSSSKLPQNVKEGTCCGTIEKATATAREKRENRTKPQPWFVRKLMVAITLGIMGYAAYVYIARLCLPMIREKAGAGAGRGTGIALLVVFCVLYFWMMWAYLKVIITPPGYASNYVQKSERPVFTANVPLHQSWNSTNFAHATTDMEMGSREQNPPTTSHPSGVGNGLAGPSYENLVSRYANANGGHEDINAGVLDAIPIPKPKAAATSSPTDMPQFVPTTVPTASSTTVTSPSTFPSSPTKLKNDRPPASAALTATQRSEKQLEREQRLLELNVDRRPPTTAVLQPVHRYCGMDEFVKPYRAHHCRVCGTCVLKYDHHCPWIGQCVGGRNHKFFLNFCQATVVFTSYVFATLLAFTVRRMNALDGSAGDVDAQEIVIIALAALFMLFTSTLIMSHVNMILKGQTTVETMQIQTMKEREARSLAKAFGWWEFGEKKRLRRQWDEEWGRLDLEGNIWWRGSRHAEWTDVMGDWWAGWIFPVGRPMSDGLNYPVNPRFDSEGRWRRRADWPEGYR
ncbi:DHHC palmitoyltransferase-domain-containing protein [Crassisporium funariophilum]|nr:DHHC palmitoyltransferase-domain-containing protein [Crassisporium funariophilum]